jgi:hypothetical protein
MNKRPLYLINSNASSGTTFFVEVYHLLEPNLQLWTLWWAPNPCGEPTGWGTIVIFYTILSFDILSFDTLSVIRHSVGHSTFCRLTVYIHTKCFSQKCRPAQQPVPVRGFWHGGRWRSGRFSGAWPIPASSCTRSGTWDTSTGAGSREREQCAPEGKVTFSKYFRLKNWEQRNYRFWLK